MKAIKQQLTNYTLSPCGSNKRRNYNDYKPDYHAGGGVLDTAEILVTAPSGSTIDLIQNSVVLQSYTLSDTETQYTFTVSSLGTYTIKATNGTKVKTQDVLVDMMNTNYTVEISYILKLYWYGEECEDVTGGWVKSANKNALYMSFIKRDTEMYCAGNSTSGSYTAGDGGFRSNDAVNLSKFNTLYINLISITKESTYSDGNAGKIFLDESYTRVENDDTSQSKVEYVVRDNGCLTIDISDVSSQCYILLYAYPWGGSMTVDKIWLE